MSNLYYSGRVRSRGLVSAAASLVLAAGAASACTVSTDEPSQFERLTEEALAPAPPATDTAAWHQREIALVTGPTTRALRLALKIMDGSGTIWYDDISVRAVLAPASERIGGTVTGTTAESLAALRPAFRDGGTVTAGNAAGINDGAAALLLASEAAVERYGAADLAVGRRVTYDVAANWKLIVENFMECYHCATIHPELTGVLPEFAEGFAAQYFVGHGAAFAEDAQGFTVDGRAGAQRLPGIRASRSVPAAG